jgi:methyl-accepting chemotaxis protein
MSRLSYGLKFLLIAVLFLIPLGALAVALLQQYSATITFARKEREGTAYLIPLYAFMVNVGRHRTMEYGLLQGDASAVGELAKIKEEMKSVIEAMNNVDDRYGKSFKVSSIWSGMRTQWSMLADDAQRSGVEGNLAKHTQLIEDAKAMMGRISDSSNLTLDPALATYYLMDMTVNRIPQLTAEMERLRGIGYGALSAKIKILTPSEKQGYETDVNKLGTLIEALQKDWVSATGVEPKIDRIRKTYQEGSGLAQRFGPFLEKAIIYDEKLSMAPADFYAESASVIEGNTKLHAEVSAMLDKLLQERIDGVVVERNILTLLTLVVLFVLAAFFAGFYMNVGRAVRALVRQSEVMAQGDLTYRSEVDTKDELSAVSRGFNGAAESFRLLLRANREMAGQVNASSGALASIADQSVASSGRIADIMGDMEGEALRQEQDMKRNSASISEMAEGIIRIAETASVVSEAAGAAAAEAKGGDASVAEAVSQMHRIRSNTDETAAAVAALRESSSAIGNFTKQIREIAAQTNLLALNANIEAARAGEHGKGFAVVAQEIRLLADQSGRSAQGIASLVTGIHVKMEETVKAIELGRAESDRGIAAMEEVNRSFALILQAVGQVASQIEEVSAATEQLTAGTQEVTASLEEAKDQAIVASGKSKSVSESANEQLASMQEVLSASQSLSTLVERLNGELGKFNV